jgi:hypothetical protein
LKKENQIEIEKEIVELESTFHPNILSAILKIRSKEIKKKDIVIELDKYINEIKEIDKEIIEFFNTLQINK